MIGFFIFFLIFPIVAFFGWMVIYTLLDIAFYWIVWLLVQFGVKVRLNQYSYMWLNVVATFYFSYRIYQTELGGFIAGMAFACGLFTLLKTSSLWIKGTSLIGG